MSLEEKPKDFETIIAEKDAEILKLRERIKELESDLMHDVLTGLETRKHFEGEMQGIISSIANPEPEQRKEGFRNIAFLFCDIDNFKKINDEQGHGAGDEVLKKVAGILKENIRDTDSVCRWGGEEMIISLAGASEAEAAEKAEQLRKKVEEAGVSISVGISSFEPGLDYDELIKRSDQAMYKAKKMGKNRIIKYSELGKGAGVV